MAPEKKAPVQDGGVQVDVLVRLLSLPMVSATREVIKKTYSSTKETHPLIYTVCGVYERGARTAGSVAAWSMQPAISKLEPHIVAVNNLACKGLDRLEEKIPAIQYPPEKLASGIAEMVAFTVQSAKDGLTNTSDKALGLASGGYQRTCDLLSDSAEYVWTSRPVRLAGDTADTALTITEHLVNYILPASEEEMDEEVSREQESDEDPLAPQPSYRRLGSLAGTVCRRAYGQAAARLQHVPGVPVLTSFTNRNLDVAGGVALTLQGSVSGLFGSTEKECDQEKEEEKEESGRIQSVVGHLQSACGLVMSGVKSAPGVTMSLAKESTGTVMDTLSSTKHRMLRTVSHYGLLPGLTSDNAAAQEDEEMKRRTSRSQSNGGGVQEQKPACEGPLAQVDSSKTHTSQSALNKKE